MQLSVVVPVYILSSKEANQLQALYIKTLGNILGNFLLKLWSSNESPAVFFVEVLGQQLKRLLWEIMF